MKAVTIAELFTEQKEYHEKINEEYGIPQYVLDHAAYAYKEAQNAVVVIDWDSKTIDFHRQGDDYAKAEPVYFMEFSGLDDRVIFHLSHKSWIDQTMLSMFASAVMRVDRQKTGKGLTVVTDYWNKAA